MLFLFTNLSIFYFLFVLWYYLHLLITLLLPELLAIVFLHLYLFYQCNFIFQNHLFFRFFFDFVWFIWLLGKCSRRWSLNWRAWTPRPSTSSSWTSWPPTSTVTSSTTGIHLTSSLLPPLIAVFRWLQTAVPGVSGAGDRPGAGRQVRPAGRYRTRRQLSVQVSQQVSRRGGATDWRALK